jgi:hypothetical protein
MEESLKGPLSPKLREALKKIEERGNIKSQITSPAPNRVQGKHQAPNKFQIIKLEIPNKTVSAIRNWCLEIIWDLPACR